MKQDFNFFNQPEELNLILTKPNREPIEVLNYAYDITLIEKLNEVDELTFKFPKYILENGSLKENKQYSALVGMKNIFIPNKGYYIVQNPSEELDGSSVIKTAKCYSAEYELAKKKLKIGRAHV